METITTASMSDERHFSITETVQQFGKKLFGFVRGKVKTTEEAEDILQDVWYQFSRLSNLDELENVSAWLYRVAQNRVTDNYRKKKTDNLEDYTYENDENEISFKEILLLDENASPELALFKEEFWNELMQALDELPENQREVFLLNEIEDFTLQEIADQKGENLKTIISRKGYAVKHLRKRLQHLYNELNF
ncbi:RNA polymerase subunit sigma-24 [Cloacibacterium rupense]|uniref:RNA polymerase subunit sigma-24 n=1 Tax=Cloacibacterium rupense TaxID=517423 RepID=A0ABQ2NJ05_9FLAO|nr:RNA polymerase sigma factor [Cloacibacterium rupense]GGP04544.1 RNA polymerase subunit sigma-24 [Cloacibacterium rupense]